MCIFFFSSRRRHTRWTGDWSSDVCSSDLRSVEPVSATSIVLGNKMEGTGDGLEAWGSYQAARNWRLSAGAFFLKQRLRPKPDSADSNVSAAGNDPAHQWLLRSSFDLPNRTELDIGVRRVGLRYRARCDWAGRTTSAGAIGAPGRCLRRSRWCPRCPA